MTIGGWKGVGVGDAFGAAVIKINCVPALGVAIGAPLHPAREKLAIRINHRKGFIVKDWDSVVDRLWCSRNCWEGSDGRSRRIWSERG